MESCVAVRWKEVVWKDYMEGIKSDEDYWDCGVGDAVEGTVSCVCGE